MTAAAAEGGALRNDRRPVRSRRNGRSARRGCGSGAAARAHRSAVARGGEVGEQEAEF